MKNQFRASAQVVLLLLFFSGCSEDVHRSSSVAEAVLGTDPAATILEVFDEPDRFIRTEKLISVLRAVPADQAHVFVEVLRGFRFPNRELERVLILTAWAKYDAPAATRWAKSYERTEVVRQAMFSESVYQWALEDHESFLSDMGMAVYTSRGWDKSMLRAFIRGWFHSGEDRLMQYIRDMGRQSTDRQRAIDVLVELLIERDGAVATIEWAKAQPGDASFRKNVYARVASKTVRVEPELTVDWCAEVCDSPLGELMPHLMALAWVRESGEEAMNFITSLPNAVGVRTGARAAYRRFLIDEPDRAAEWMENTTEERRQRPMMQGPIGMYMNRLSGQGHPLLAIEWLEYIKDEEERNARLIPVMRRWLKQDEAAAEAWMAQSSMSEDALFKAHNSMIPIGTPRGSVEDEPSTQ